MYPFVSLEDVLSPHGEPTAPTVGLMVGDWDANLKQGIEAITDLGHRVVVLPMDHASMEADDEQMGTGDPVSAVKIHGSEPVVRFYYKGKPDDAVEGIPVLIVEGSKVKVDMEGRVKELAEALGLLDDDRLQLEPSDGEYE